MSTHEYNLRARDPWAPKAGSGWKTTRSFFVSHCEEKNLEHALYVVKKQSPNKNIHECWQCKRTGCAPQFERQLTWVGVTLKRSLSLICPDCGAQMGYYVWSLNKKRYRQRVEAVSSRVPCMCQRGARILRDMHV